VLCLVDFVRRVFLSQVIQNKVTQDDKASQNPVFKEVTGKIFQQKELGEIVTS
jgi:hypothetical protein